MKFRWHCFKKYEFIFCGSCATKRMAHFSPEPSLMKKIFLLFAPAALFTSATLNAQQIKTTDSSRTANIQTRDQLPPAKTSTADREFLLKIMNEGQAGKEQLIAYLDSNYYNINALVTRYRELVPEGYSVFIAFKASERYGETFDITIRRTGKKKKIETEWTSLDMHWHSAGNLISEKLGWTYGSVMQIRQLLKTAHCSSIENGDITTIGMNEERLPGDLIRFYHRCLSVREKQTLDGQAGYLVYKTNIVIQIRRDAMDLPSPKEPE